LGELLGQHGDYRVKVTGNTDYVGSERYNDKLGLARAGAVREFLIKYGASAGQITASGNGERNPEVNNNTKEGRFMNRRVTLTVTDGGQGVGSGGVGDAIKSLAGLDLLLKKQEEAARRS
jgi:outer membrane protein OmpA-like peptidoglycan-associated protein